MDNAVGHGGWLVDPGNNHKQILIAGETGNTDQTPTASGRAIGPGARIPPIAAGPAIGARAVPRGVLPVPPDGTIACTGYIFDWKAT